MEEILNTHYSGRTTQDDVPPSLDGLFQDKFRLEDDLQQLQQAREGEMDTVAVNYYKRERNLRAELFKTISKIDRMECELNKGFGLES